MSPGFDRAGPRGLGPMTGRGLGPCGRGFGRGFGWGWRTAPVAPAYPAEQVVPVYREPTKEQEMEMLKAEKAEIEADLKEIEKKLKEIGK